MDINFLGCNRKGETALKQFSADQNTFCIGGFFLRIKTS